MSKRIIPLFSSQTPGAPLIAHFAMSGIPPRTDGRGSNFFRHKHPVRAITDFQPAKRDNIS
jgi:hypothetical protein